MSIVLERAAGLIMLATACAHEISAHESGAHAGVGRGTVNDVAHGRQQSFMTGTGRPFNKPGLNGAVAPAAGA